MTKYRAEITIEFDTATNIPEVSLSGTMAEVGSFFDNLPNPTDVNEQTSKASVRIAQMVEGA